MPDQSSEATIQYFHIKRVKRSPTTRIASAIETSSLPLYLLRLLYPYYIYLPEKPLYRHLDCQLACQKDR